MRLSRLSTEFVKVPVGVTLNGLQFDITQDLVFLACTLPRLEPQSSDWKAGSWETVRGKAVARLLVGPVGDLILQPGWYDVWIKVVDNVERPVVRAGELLIF